MKHSLLIFLSATILGFLLSSLPIHASEPQKTLVITMTNVSPSNAIIVFDAVTDGQGVGGDIARGVEQYEGRDRLIFEHLIFTNSSPVSVNFANGHMYVAGITTVELFTMNGIHVGCLGSTSQAAEPMIPSF
jgi:hypothetical protein